MRAVSLIEPLEDRIAPASVTIGAGGKSATYTDATGDTVQVTTTKGSFSATQFTFDSSNNLTELNLTGSSAFNGANIVFTVFPVVNPLGGSSMVNVGTIDAAGLNLGSVTVPGDLGAIDVGDGAGAIPTALGKLTVNSLGTIGASTGTSNVTGGVGVINIAGDVDGTLFVQDYNGHASTGNIGLLNIGGSVNGGSSSVGPGDVFFTGTLKTAVIGGGIEGGSADYSGSIGGYDTTSGGFGTLAKIGSITVKGSVPDDPNPSSQPGVAGTSILGGSGFESGEIAAVTIGNAYIAGDIHGGTGEASGSLQAGISLVKATIGGSLIGGNFQAGSPSEAMNAGVIFGGNIGSLLIEKSIFGGSGIQSGQVFSTGLIQKMTVMGDVIGGSAGTTAAGVSTPGEAGLISAKTIGSVVIDGSLTGGNLVNLDLNQTGQQDGGIVSSTKIGSVYIGGNLNGGSGASSGSIVTLGGGLGSLAIGNLIGGSGASSGMVSVTGTLTKTTLSQNLTGGSGSQSGVISANVIGSLSVGKNVTGGSGNSSGLIQTLAGGAGSLTIGGADPMDGSVVGSSGDSSGIINIDGPVERLSITHNITGGSGNGSGIVSINGGLSALSIGGNVTGGTDNNTGTIAVLGALKSATINGGITGSNSVTPSVILTNTGYIQANSIGTMVVGGALTSGTIESGGGGLDTSGAIRSTTSIGSLTIGSLVGNSTNPAIISAVGQATLAANAKTDVAIGSITVKGPPATAGQPVATYADILAGYNTNTNNGTDPLGTGVNANAQIGTVKIEGNLTATNIIAGVGPGTTGFGTAGSAALSGTGVTDMASIISKISQVVITGTVIPTASMTDSYGIAAQYIASASYNGAAVPLKAGPDNDTFAATSAHDLGGGDIFLYEV